MASSEDDQDVIEIAVDPPPSPTNVLTTDIANNIAKASKELAANAKNTKSSSLNAIPPQANSKNNERQTNVAKRPCPSTTQGQGTKVFIAQNPAAKKSASPIILRKAKPGTQPVKKILKTPHGRQKTPRKISPLVGTLSSRIVTKKQLVATEDTDSASGSQDVPVVPLTVTKTADKDQVPQSTCSSKTSSAITVSQSPASYSNQSVSKQHVLTKVVWKSSYPGNSPNQVVIMAPNNQGKVVPVKLEGSNNPIVLSQIPAAESNNTGVPSQPSAVETNNRSGPSQLPAAKSNTGVPRQQVVKRTALRSKNSPKTVLNTGTIPAATSGTSATSSSNSVPVYASRTGSTQGPKAVFDSSTGNLLVPNATGKTTAFHLISTPQPSVSSKNSPKTVQNTGTIPAATSGTSSPDSVPVSASRTGSTQGPKAVFDSSTGNLLVPSSTGGTTAFRLISIPQPSVSSRNSQKTVQNTGTISAATSESSGTSSPDSVPVSASRTGSTQGPEAVLDSSSMNLLVPNATANSVPTVSNGLHFIQPKPLNCDINCYFFLFLND